MLHGKRTVAEKIVYDAMEIIQSRLEGDDQAIDTVKRAIDNVKPPLEVRSRRVGGATYQVPVEVRSASCHDVVDPLGRRLLACPS